MGETTERDVVKENGKIFLKTTTVTTKEVVEADMDRRIQSTEDQKAVIRENIARLELELASLELKAGILRNLKNKAKTL